MTTIEGFIRDTLETPAAAAHWTIPDLEWVRTQTEQAAAAAFAGDTVAAQDLHHGAYRLFVARHTAPWDRELADVANPIFGTFLWTLTREWDRADEDRHHDVLVGIPDDPESYSEWIVDLVQRHESNVSHPLFDFLADEATFDQLREFVRQETPFDIHFADILGSLLPGVYGEQKMEIAQNFWDEMGGGELAEAHRTLRLDLMSRLDLSPHAHATSPAEFALEEIELANAYFVGTADRSRAIQLIGMLMATESMVPGRLQRQIDGWRRVGLADEDMRYLLVHTVVDVEHAEDWMEHVVRPIIRERPEAVRDLTLGALRRLDVAGRICDRMMVHLPSVTAAPVGA